MSLALFWLVFLGVPGLLLGLALGAVVARWALIFTLIALAAIGVGLGLENVPDGADDDDPAVLLYVEILTNFGGLVVGLLAGRFLFGGSRSMTR